MEDYERDEEDVDICDDSEGEAESEADDAIGAAAAESWKKIGDESRLPLNKPPYDCTGGSDRMENNLRDLRSLMLTQTGEVQFTKLEQQKVELKNGFSYTQNTDGSMVVRDASGSTFVVAADNTLTVVRPNGQVETYRPTEMRYKDGGSIEYSYGPDAGFNLLRKHRGGRTSADTGVEIRTSDASFSTVVRPGRAATYEYQPEIRNNLKKIPS